MANFFTRIFGGGDVGTARPGPVSKGEKAAEKVINSIQQLNEREEQLEKRRELLEKRVEEELEKARALTKVQKKQQALMALKKKKMYQGQLEQTENLILRVNEQRLMLENQRTTAEVIISMSAAADAANDTLHEMNIGNVEDVLADITEQNDEMQAVTGALAQPLGLAADIDEGELGKELEDLESALLDEELLKEAPVPGGQVPETPLPTVPASVPASNTKVDDELAALEAELAA